MHDLTTDTGGPQEYQPATRDIIRIPKGLWPALTQVTKAIKILDPIGADNIAGTLDFMAPEVVTSNSRFDSDIITDFYVSLRRTEPAAAKLVRPLVIKFGALLQAYSELGKVVGPIVYEFDPVQSIETDSVLENKAMLRRINIRMFRRIAIGIAALKKSLNSLLTMRDDPLVGNAVDELVQRARGLIAYFTKFASWFYRMVL